jgi:hypothetical protein
MGFSFAIGMGNSPRVIAITFAVRSVGVGAVSRSGFAVGISCRCGAIAGFVFSISINCGGRIGGFTILASKSSRDFFSPCWSGKQ